MRGGEVGLRSGFGYFNRVSEWPAKELSYDNIQLREKNSYSHWVVNDPSLVLAHFDMSWPFLPLLSKGRRTTVSPHLLLRQSFLL